jgi:hypothetical protein
LRKILQRRGLGGQLGQSKHYSPRHLFNQNHPDPRDEGGSMDMKKFLIATGVAFVATVVWDFLFHGLFLSPTYYQPNTMTFVQSESPSIWLFVGELVQAGLLVYLWSRVMGSFSAGVKGGVTFGMLAHLFMMVPAAMYNHLFINGFPYALSWLWVVGGLILGAIQGAIAGALYKPAMAAKMA